MSIEKLSLDFACQIPHHEYEIVKISISDYQSDGPVMTLEVDDGQKGKASLTLPELKKAIEIFEMYAATRATLERMSI